MPTPLKETIESITGILMDVMVITGFNGHYNGIYCLWVGFVGGMLSGRWEPLQEDSLKHIL